MKNLNALALALAFIAASLLYGCSERKPQQTAPPPKAQEEIKEPTTPERETEPKTSIFLPEEIHTEEVDLESKEGVFALYEQGVDQMRYIDSVSFLTDVQLSLTSSGGVYLGEASYEIKGEVVRLPSEDFGYHCLVTSTGDATYAMEHTMVEGTLYQSYGDYKEFRQIEEGDTHWVKDELDGVAVGLPIPLYKDGLTIDDIYDGEYNKETREITLYLTNQPHLSVGALSRFLPLGVNELYRVPGETDEAGVEELLTTVSYEGEEQAEDDSQEELDDPEETGEIPYEGVLVVGLDENNHIISYSFHAVVVTTFPSGNTPSIDFQATYKVDSLNDLEKMTPPANAESYEDFTIQKESAE